MSKSREAHAFEFGLQIGVRSVTRQLTQLLKNKDVTALDLQLFAKVSRDSVADLVSATEGGLKAYIETSIKAEVLAQALADEEAASKQEAAA
jgi:hypothetical protein